MAKTGRSKGNGSKAADAPKEEQALTVTPEYGAPFPSVYSNYVSVSHTASEVFMDFCLLALPYEVDLDKKAVTAPVVARAIVPPNLISGLIKALGLQMEKQKETAKTGALAIPRPTPKGGKK